MKSKLRKTRHGRDQGLQVERIRIRQIRIPKGHRAINEKILPGMKQSIDRFGVREPIWVRPLKNGGYELVVGLHRLQVLKESGERWIDCLVTTDKKRDRKAWATSENLHRAEYDPAQRAKAVKDWRKYLKQIGDGQEAQLGGRQPKDKGISKVAQAANMSRRSARRALDVAEVKPEALKSAKAAGLGKNQTALQKIGRERTLEDQLEKVKELAEAKKKSRGPLSKVQEKQMKVLERGFKKSGDFKEGWKDADPKVRRKFTNSIMKIPTRSRAPSASAEENDGEEWVD